MAELKDWLNSINLNKKDIMVDEYEEKKYPAYIVNKCLAPFPDTVFYVNEMNRLHFLDNRLQYEFLLNSVRPQKRFARWVKDAGDKELDMICATYKCNRNIAREYLPLLSSEQLNFMEQQLETGGNKK